MKKLLLKIIAEPKTDTPERAMLSSKLVPGVEVHAKILGEADHDLFRKALSKEPEDRIRQRFYMSVRADSFGDRMISVQKQFGTKIVLLFSSKIETPETFIGFGDIGYPKEGPSVLARYICEGAKKKGYGSLLLLILLSQVKGPAVTEFDKYENPTVSASYQRLKELGVPVWISQRKSGDDYDHAHFSKYVEPSLDIRED